MEAVAAKTIVAMKTTKPMKTTVAMSVNGTMNETMNETKEPKPKVLSPLERIELPTGASLGRVFARGWKGRGMSIRF